MKIAHVSLIVVVLGASAWAWSQPAPPTSLTVREAVAYGLEHSPMLRASRASVLAARAQSDAAKGRTRPQVSASAFASDGSMPNMLRSAMGVEPASMVRAPEGGFFNANLMLMAPLYTGGMLSGMVAAANATEAAAVATDADTRAEVALRIRNAYLRALYEVELVAAQEARVKAAEAMVANARDQFEAGRGIEAMVRRADAELAEAQGELRMAENERRKGLLDLLEEMGAALDAPVELRGALQYAAPTGTLAGSLAEADKTRGELLAARRRVRAAQGEAESARGALHPQIYGFAMGDVFSPGDAMGQRSGYTAGIVLSVPLVDGGTRRAEVATTRAMIAQMQAEADRTRLRVEKEVRQAWLDIETAEKNLATAEAALVAAQAAYEVITLRFETGKSILVEQLDALAATTRARANRARALFEYTLALATLDRAVGVAGPKGDETR